MSEYTAEAAALIRNRPGLAREIARQLARNGYSQARQRRTAHGLTPVQAKLLDFMRSYHRVTGLTPTYREMMFALDLASKSGIHRLVTALEERGHIVRIPGKERSIALCEARA